MYKVHRIAILLKLLSTMITILRCININCIDKLGKLEPIINVYWNTVLILIVRSIKLINMYKINFKNFSLNGKIFVF